MGEAAFECRKIISERVKLGRENTSARNETNKSRCSMLYRSKNNKSRGSALHGKSESVVYFFSFRVEYGRRGKRWTLKRTNPRGITAC